MLDLKFLKLLLIASITSFLWSHFRSQETGEFEWQIAVFVSIITLCFYNLIK